MYGFTGKILHVDLTTGQIEVEQPPESFYRTYWGGSAMGTYYLLKHTPAGADPLGPQNTLSLMLSVITGAPVSIAIWMALYITTGRLLNRAEKMEKDRLELKSQLFHAAKLVSVGELAAGIAHEVNNPVNFALNAARAEASSLPFVVSALLNSFSSCVTCCSTWP